MELVRWNPARGMMNFRNPLGSFFDDFFYPLAAPLKRRPYGTGNRLWISTKTTRPMS